MGSFFANPWMLAGIVAVTLPIIIEWLFKRRKRLIDLPTIRFLLRSKEQEKIKRQDRILLILRMVGIGLLFAVAREYRLDRHPGHRLLEAAGCYWHLVDLLWVGIFLILYLL
ncbi:MAG: BatA domain-containing protein [Planctomycetota bacterium]|nr:BatA domain-containing protein [Planctomycetota bacterium]